MRVRRKRGRLERLFYERAAGDHRRWPATSQAECLDRVRESHPDLADHSDDELIALYEEGGREPDEYWYDADAARRVTEMFFPRYTRHYKGEWAGDPIILESHQKVFYNELFGWMRPDGTRRFREAYKEIPRKNGKSTEAAGVGNYALTADGEPGAEVY